LACLFLSPSGLSSAEDTLTTEDEYSFIKRQIRLNETSEAEKFLDDRIQSIENKHHLTHPSLVKPLTLLGDTKTAKGEITGALLLYDRAIFVQRVNYGLFHPEQLEIIYKEADSHASLGNLEDAQKREEYAYEILVRSFGEDDTQRVPGLLRLAKFYDKIHGYLASRVFYRKALQILITNGKGGELQAIPLHYGIAHSYLMERFPPFYISNGFDTRSIGLIPGLDDADLFQQHLSVNNFPEGERALQSSIAIATAQDPQNAEQIEEATMKLADWHLMWDRQKDANTLYAAVYKGMEARGIDPTQIFGEPFLVYLPEPKQPTPPPIAERLDPKKGFVELDFLVKTNGRIAKLQTIEAEPPKLMEFQIRRSLREAVFRPAFFEGLPVKNYLYKYTYEFDYFPSLPEDNTNK
jgi:tetratricopeptide (TPR) repeat protein